MSQICTYRQRNEIKGPVILSDEHFFGGEYNGNSEFPILYRSTRPGPILARFVEELATVGRDWSVTVRVIVTIRNQIDWIGSKYAQASAKILCPSQKDFERRVKRFSKLRETSWCDWSVWINGLDQVLGKNNVDVLCLEEISTPEFWEKIDNIGGLHIESGGSSTGTIDLPHLNNRASGDRVWALGHLNLGACIAKRLRVIPRGKREAVLLRVGSALKWVRLESALPRGERISIDPRIAACISDSCGNGNAWLEIRTGKNLRELGYPVERR